MITNEIIIRYAENINYPNEIADFSGYYSIKNVNKSAVSWELPRCYTRRDYCEYLIKSMIKKIYPENKLAKIRVIIKLSGEQPNNVIVNYKKTWGLLSGRGVNTDNIHEKINFLKRTNNGLILSGTGIVNLHDDNIIKELINSGEKVFFASYESDEKINIGNIFEWMNQVWENKGIVFMALGLLDEISCEAVAIGNSGGDWEKSLLQGRTDRRDL